MRQVCRRGILGWRSKLSTLVYPTEPGTFWHPSWYDKAVGVTVLGVTQQPERADGPRVFRDRFFAAES